MMCARSPGTRSAIITRSGVRPGGAQKLDLRTGLSKEFLQEALSTRVGKALEEKLSAYGIDLNASAGIDMSSDATADRIVQGTTGLLGVFARQNPDLSESELVDKFEQTVRGAVKKGIGEALDILKGFKEFDSGIASMVDDTSRLVDQKFDAYFADLQDIDTTMENIQNNYTDALRDAGRLN